MDYYLNFDLNNQMNSEYYVPQILKQHLVVLFELIEKS